MNSHTDSLFSNAAPSVDYSNVSRRVRLAVDYDLPISRAIELNKYAWVNDDVLRLNSIPKTGSSSYIHLGLIQFSQVIRTNDVLQRMTEGSFQPAGLRELLAFTPYFDAEPLFPIVALGSVFQDSNGQRHAVCLYGNCAETNLGLNSLQFGWNRRHRFLVVLAQNR
jgi:hypothetical protein